ncbi:hypothetical protein CGQ24_10515 [Arthrobacter sp. 7749]|nr:hypothetical protein CGQ24_10515 [Arthrobacter sp. 7749]
MVESEPDDEPIDEPLDGRDSQTVDEGASDGPRTMEYLNPFQDAELLAGDPVGHEARAEADKLLHTPLKDPNTIKTSNGSPATLIEISGRIDHLSKRPA